MRLMGVTRRARGLRVILGLVVAFALVPGAPVAAISVSCSRISAKMIVDVTGSGEVVISRNRGGTILIDGTSCSGGTVTNIDYIRVNGDSADQIVKIDMANGTFAPGFTNEVGSSDELEFYFYLGAGNSGAKIFAGAADDNIRLGYTTTTVGAVPRINLNAGETTGIDADIYVVSPTFGMFASGSTGADTISAAGGAGTGDPWINTGMKISGGNGADTLTGGPGPDSMIGGPGTDVLNGAQGADSLEVDDGVSGNDTINGGQGVDFCTFDPGDTVNNC